MYKDHLDVNPEVVKALEEGRPVVALESTIIAHGMPYPKNVETALAVEEVIRANGAVPATIGILSGRIKIGLTKEEIEYMAHAENVLKVSRRDLPLAISKKMDGATTVAGTMIAAHMAGIKLFVTGGIGGVHRGAGESFDISADLEELKMTDVTVVCAGAKAISLIYLLLWNTLKLQVFLSSLTEQTRSLLSTAERAESQPSADLILRKKSEL